MKEKLIDKIADKVTVSYNRLSIVSNPDGLLTQTVVCNLLNSQKHINIIIGTNLQLRIHYELVYKENTSERYVYVADSIDSIVPDMLEDVYVTKFSIADIFPLFANKSLLRKQPFNVLDKLYERCSNRRVSFEEGQWMIDSINNEIIYQKMTSAEHYNKLLSNLAIDWDKPLQTINDICMVMKEAISSGVYENISDKIAKINDTFQNWIDDYYFATLHSSPLLHPKTVNGVLPYISNNFNNNEKIALVVVDGFSYWQWLLLRDELRIQVIKVNDGTTLAWLPTITMLSRQAIFRGEAPKLDYKQSTDNEERMWRQFWQGKGFSSFAIQYLCDKDEFAINEETMRLAYVTVEMDKKMHSSTDYIDLYDLTENWCPRITEKLQLLLKMDYHIILTTDHGCVLSEGWRNLTQQEKVFLYKDGSRGKRHLIYNNISEQQRFAKDNSEIRLLNHDNFLCMRDNQCFDTKESKEITHGGSHFLEVVIPFIEIDKQ